MTLSKEEQERCVQLLKKSVLLKACKDQHLLALAKKMEKKTYHKGSSLIHAGEPQTRMFVIADGEAIRERNISGQVHHIDTHLGGSTFGSLHVMNQDPSYATAKCMTEVTTYELPSSVINDLFRRDNDFAKDVVTSLTLEIRTYTKANRTPLLEQQPKKTPFIPVSIAAGIESFYRAALNSVLNQQLSGVKPTTYFPNMHVQTPVRIIYINGFKGLRQYFNDHVDPDTYSNPAAVRLAVTLAPGIIMTPFSSILEASNAHANPEKLSIKWTRGLVPRTAREIIFGIGLNQLSDYCEERVPFFENPAMRNAAGSLMAGVISGYMSHVVHNMSTLKLINPNKSYREHFKDYVAKYENRIPTNMSPGMRRFLALSGSVLFPQGVHIRTGQIVGSFIILNGTINAMQKYTNL